MWFVFKFYKYFILQVNEALSGEVSQIIADEPSSTSSSEMSSVLEQSQGSSTTRNTSDIAEEFVPYLLVHSIVSSNSGANKTKSEWKRDKLGSGSPKNVNLVSTVQDLMMPQIMEVDEEPDVQIIGYSPPSAMNNNTAPSTLLKQLLGEELATSNDMKLEDVSMEDGDISNGAPEMFGLPELMENKSGQVTVDVDKPGEVVVLHSDKPPSGKDKSDSDGGGGGGKGGGVEYPPVVEKEGHAAQCIALPPEVTPDQYVVSITPNHQSSHVIIVTAPKTLHRRISALCGITAHCHGGSDNASSSADNSHNDAVSNRPAEQNNATASAAPSVPQNETRASTGGCLLIYKANVEKGRMVLLHEKPVVTRVLDSINDGIMSVLLLPRDIAQGQGDEVDAQRPDLLTSLQQQPSAAAAGADLISAAAASECTSNSGNSSSSNDLLDGYIAVTTYSGSVNVIRISDCKVLLTIPPPEGDKFVSLTYCTGKKWSSHRSVSEK